MEIDYAILSSLPVNSSAFKSLHSYADTHEEDAEGAEADDSSLEPGLAQGTTSPYPSKENAHASELFACINPLHSEERNESKIARILT